MIYLASPYSSDRALNFKLVEQATATMLQQGHLIFSPIVHCHEIAEKYSLPTDYKFWEAYATGMLTRANELWVLQIPGWRESLGVQSEIIHARRCQIPVYTVNITGTFKEKLPERS